MEQCLRIVLFVVFLSAHLGATPVRDQLLLSPLTVNYVQQEMGFQLLRDSVSCGPNVTFVSPTNVDVRNCSAVALKVFKEGLQRAEELIADGELCTDGEDRISEINGYMAAEEENATRELVSLATLSQCQWSEKKNFTGFLDDFQNLISMSASARGSA